MDTETTLYTVSDTARPRNHQLGNGDDHGSDDLVSVLTSNSAETLTNDLFNHSVSDFKLIHLPLVSSLLSSDVQVFKNKHLLETQSLAVTPLLSTSTSFLNYFKVNAPFLVINKHGQLLSEHTEEPEIPPTTSDLETPIKSSSKSKTSGKSALCRSFHKVLCKNLLCYILFFENKEVVVLFNNELKPYVDFEWRNLKFRIVGTTGATSTFGNGLIKLFLVSHSYNTLSDHILVTINNPLLRCPKDISITLPEPLNRNPLLENLLKTNKPFVNHNLSSTNILASTPLATFIDDNKKLKKYFSNGCIKLFDPLPQVDHADNPDISDTGLVLVSILLTLREQEVRKNKGNNKPTYK